MISPPVVNLAVLTLEQQQQQKVLFLHTRFLYFSGSAGNFLDL